MNDILSAAKWILWLALLVVTLLPVSLQGAKAGNDSLRTEAFRLLNLGNCREARQYGYRLLEQGKRENDSNDAGLYGHLILGLASIESDENVECYTHLETARALAERTQNHEALMRIYNGLGNYSLFMNDDVYSAISYYFQAIEEAKAADNLRQYAMTLSNLSGAYFMRNDTSGLKYAEEAIRIAQERHECTPLYYGTMNATLYYLKTKQTEKAQTSLRKLKQMQDAYGFEGKSDLYLLNAMLCELKDDTRQAYANYACAMENFKSASPSTITMVYLEYAKLLKKDNHLPSAIRVLEHGLDQISSSKVPIYKAQLLKELSLCYREAGQYAEALTYATAYQDYQEKRFDEIRERATQETRIKHDIYSRERQISEQRMEILNNRYRIVFLSGALVVLIVAWGMSYRSYKKKDRLYRAIVTQNREYLSREQMLMEQIETLRKNEEPQSPSPLSSDKQHDLMSRFTALMIERRLFTNPSLTVASVADELGTNRTYLSKAINESTGKTFTQIVNDYRICQAIAEISDFQTDKPLKQIATEVGFNSLSTFYTTFQASTEMTPARYRAKLKELQNGA